MSYAGRYTHGLLSRNFGGINRDASIVNIGDNQAYDITNFDIGQRGTIKRRKGYTALSTVGDVASPLAIAFFAFPDTDNITRYFAVAYNVSGVLLGYEADSPSGPWTACGGSVVFTEESGYKYVGIPWKGKLYLVNGTDAPVVIEPGEDCQTLKAASLLPSPDRFNGVYTGSAPASTGGFQAYGISSITPVGESDILSFSPRVSAATYYNLDGVTGNRIDGVTRFFTLSWDAVPGVRAYGIYLYSSGLARYYKIDEVPYGTTTWIDTAFRAGLTDENGNLIFAETINSAYNTPDWESTGYPTGGLILGRGRGERLLLWRNDTIFGSAVADPLDWWTSGNAMVFAVTGDGDVEIVAGSNLFDYLMLFSKRQCWIFTGSGPSDISLEKTLAVGCAGPHAITQVGTDTYLMSQFGPTTFKRIMSGADVAAAHSWADKIKPVLFEETNINLWDQTFVYNDLQNSRVIWTMPKVGETTNGMSIVYQYDTESFTRYDSTAFVHPQVVNYNIYGLTDSTTTNSVVQIGVGNTDDGTPISATYKTCWFDHNSWEMTKRMTWVDVVASREGGDYTFSVQWDWDYQQYTSSAIICTETTTDGATIDTTSPLSTEHRIYTDGVGNAVQLIFTASSGDEVIEILGWRPDSRSKGLRKL